MTTILPALISATASLIVCLINNYVQGQKHREDYNRTMAIMEVKLESLTKAVEKHNSVVERVYALEKQDAVFTEALKVANHRIEDLEKEVNNA